MDEVERPASRTFCLADDPYAPFTDVHLLQIGKGATHIYILLQSPSEEHQGPWLRSIDRM